MHRQTLIFLLLPFIAFSQSWKLGEFNLTYLKTSGEPGQLTITHSCCGARAVFATRAGSSFVLGADSLYESRDWQGCIGVEELTLHRCEEQTVDLVERGVALNGSTLWVAFQGKLCSHTPYVLNFSVSPLSSQLQFQVTVENTKLLKQVLLRYSSDPGESFFGFGAQYSVWNMSGARLPIFVREQGIGRGLEPLTALLNVPGYCGGDTTTTYTAIAHYITSNNRSLLIQNEDYIVFDLQTPQQVTIEVNSSTLSGRILAGDSPLSLIESLTALTGRMAPLPAWISQGAVVGTEGGYDTVMDQINLLLQTVPDIPIAALWLQDWSGEIKDATHVGVVWNWEVDLNLYPQWVDWIESLAAKGINMMTYINPMLANVSEQSPAPPHNYYQYAADHGYLVKGRDGEVWPYTSTKAMIDLSNPDAYNWLKSLIVNNMLATGVKGWMADFGEALPLHAECAGCVAGDQHDGTAQWHTRWPALWQQLNREACQEAQDQGLIKNASDIVYFSRSASLSSLSFARLFWLGDQLPSWDFNDGIGTAVLGMITSGVSGMSLQHSDIGGYNAISYPELGINYVRSKEILMRWCELSAFSAVYRTHPGSDPRVGWEFYDDVETMQHFAKFAKVYVAWDFYRAQLMSEAASKGYPLVRHLALHYNDPTTHQLTAQYLVGSELLVAPVVVQGATQVKVYLPAGSGSWLSVWSNQTVGDGGVSGNWIVMPSTIGSPAVLYRSGSAVGVQFVANLQKI